MEWLTDLLPAPTGPEQRRRLREAPRVSLQFDSLEEADARRRMENLLAVNGSGLWRVPLVSDALFLTAAMAIGATAVPADAADLRFSAGGLALIVGRDPAVFDVVAIVSVVGGAITLDAPGVTHAWPEGSRVLPLVTCRLRDVPQLPRFTDQATPLRIEFTSAEPMDWTPSAGAAAYRGAPVLEIRPDWSTDPEFTPERGLAIVDNDTGQPAVFDQSGIALGRYAFGFSLYGRTELAAFRSLLYAMAGRWSPIWVPSQAQDFRVVAPLVSASPNLDVAPIGFADWPLQVNRQDLRIELATGEVLYRRITDTAVLGGGGERLILDANLGVNATVEQVRSVEFLALCRQDSDVNLL